MAAANRGMTALLLTMIGLLQHKDVPTHWLLFNTAMCKNSLKGS
jgi:hypothetical protein